MLCAILLSLCLFNLGSSSSVIKLPDQALSQVPAYSPTYRRSFATPYHKHHHRHHHRHHSKNYPAPSPTQSTSPQGKSPAVSPTLFTPPEDRDCEEISCSAPLTKTAIGSPCGCVYPIRVVLDIAVASYIFLTLVPVLEIDIAAGTFLKQSQVKITSASPRDEGRTGVTVELVPLGSKFDKMTALLIHQRFWQKKVTINNTLFHEYKVISIDYPGLPLPPPTQDGSDSASESDHGGNPQYPITANVSDDTSQKMNARIVAVIAVSSFLLLFLSVGVFIFVLKALKHKREDSVHGLAPSLLTRRSGVKAMIPSSLASSTSASFFPNISACPPSLKTFTLVELEKATYGFSASRKLGEGGFGCVYHGILEDGSDVAVKLLKGVDQNRHREREFISEVEILSRLHHRNLVKLIGVCIEEKRHCLVYELIRNGSVESHLHGDDKEKGLLDWDARMKIALGSARALAYLHEDSNPRVIHRDFKASNILLEDDFTPKVSDFGLAREAAEGTQHVSTVVMGTFGYVAPEYAMTGHLLIKSDVYSYGVVLLELLSGRKPVHISSHRDPESLVVWARPLLATQEGLLQLTDPRLQRGCDLDALAKVAAVASVCVHSEPSQRPFMGEVVQALKLVSSGKDAACCCDDDNSCSQNGSSPARGELFPPGSSWCSEASTQLGYYGNYAGGSVFLNMDCSSGSAGAASPVKNGSQSDDSRMRRMRRAFQRLRGTVSEHGYPMKRPR